ncbi:hypothetical protein E2C01_058051 [Portunus trituberculatus]|uniref:Uncharacterized protein n=1 Tax=Portunus trituberculatus TaxID=210409 RepID=A0A5B7H1M2_PORTR|nr:hypothetical protein [Portunus trituberculatus]
MINLTHDCNLGDGKGDDSWDCQRVRGNSRGRSGSPSITSSVGTKLVPSANINRSGGAAVAPSPQPTKVREPRIS